MKLNNKGFVASTLMYSLLVLFLFLILGLIALLSNRKMILDKLKNDIKDEINSTKKYAYYENGTPIYFNPKTGKLCSDYIEENSQTGVTEGCLKFYAFNDDINRSTVNMILDHNTSGNVAWNSSGNNEDGMNEVATRLSKDTAGWVGTPRLITANEIAHIVGADSNDTIKWKQSNTYGTDDTSTKSAWFYFDGSGTTYSSSDGWQKQVANATTPSNYAWLYDYTNGCESYGCTTADSSTYGYWTQDAVVGNSGRAWGVDRNGNLSRNNVDIANRCGVRPVITVSKKDVKFGGTYVASSAGQTHKGILYLDPTDLNKTCNETLALANVDSTTHLPTGINEGCMKFYIFDNSGSKYKMILDHNTTALVPYETSGTYKTYENTSIKIQTDLDTAGWLFNSRFITADEIAKITGADTEINWTTTTATDSDWFCLDTNEKDETNYCAKSQGTSSYKWLFDYLNGCTSYGCDTEDLDTYGYWTSSAVYNKTDSAWGMNNIGDLLRRSVNTNDRYGVRPVIELYKTIVK